MDFSGVQGMLMRNEQQQQPTLMYFNESGNVIMTENNGAYGEVMYQDCVPVQTGVDRVLFLDENGYLREGYQDISSNAIIVSQDTQSEDDGETPPHVLDHMYAKKPRDPGMEQAPPKPRRRTKRKSEQVVEQYVVPEPQPQTPKINIIRQHLPTSVYKSIPPSRPKILQGANPKGGSQSPVSPNYTSPTKAKEAHARHNLSGSPSGRTGKKEDPLAQGMYVTLEDDASKGTSTGARGGSGNVNGVKLGAKEYASKPWKSYLPKLGSTPIILDELQSRPGGATGYDDEMLFDFGLEDDDEVRCTLSSEEFGDVVFDECSFSSGLEVYNPVNNVKPTSLPKQPSSVVTSTILLSQRPLKKNSMNASVSGISDDDDSNQIMVSMGNRRKSKEWEVTEKSESKEEPINQNNDESSEEQSASFPLEKPQETITAAMSNSVKETNEKGSFELSSASTCSASTPTENQPEIITGDITDLIVTPCVKKVKNKKVSKSADAALAVSNITSNDKSVPEQPPTRRSMRAVKAPAWLDDSAEPPLTKRKRR